MWGGGGLYPDLQFLVQTLRKNVCMSTTPPISRGNYSVWKKVACVARKLSALSQFLRGLHLATNLLCFFFFFFFVILAWGAFGQNNCWL